MKELSELMNPDVAILGRVTKEEHYIMMEKMQNLINAPPTQGRITYKLLPREVKDLVDDMVKDITSRPDVKKELIKYYDSVDRISDSYSANEHRKESNRTFVRHDIERRLANVVVTTAKTIRMEEQQKIYQEKQMIQCASSACFSLVRNSINAISDATRTNNVAEAFHTNHKLKAKKKRSNIIIKNDSVTQKRTYLWSISVNFI